MKRGLLVLLAAIVAAGTVSAAPALNPPGTYPIVTSPIEVSAVAVYLTIESSGKPQEAAMTKYLENLTGIHIKFRDVLEGQSGQAQEKINLMLSSGDLPDVFLTWSYITPQMAYQYGSQGMFVALNKLIDARMPNYKRELAKYPEYKKQLTAPDGNMYAFPYLEAGCFHCSMQVKYWMYMPWLTKLGLKVPTTTDELYTVLKAFKTRDPNGNGKADEIPLAGSVDGWNANPMNFIMNAFAYTHRGTDGGFLQNDNGKISFVANTPEWRNGLKFMAKLYKEGLIAPETFTQKNEQLRAAVENPGVPLVGSYADGWYGDVAVNGAGTGRFADFQPIAPVAGPTGLRQTTYFPASALTAMLITKNAKYPEAMAQWADFWFDKPILKTALGFYGSTIGNGLRLPTAAELKAGMVSRDGTPAEFVQTNALNYGKDKFDDGWDRAVVRWGPYEGEGMPLEWAKDPSQQEWRLMVATRDLMKPFKVNKYLPANLIFDKSVQKEMTDVATNVASTTGVVEQWSTQFITGTKDINSDAQWQAYINELKSAGVDRYVQIYQDTLKKNGY